MLHNRCYMGNTWGNYTTFINSISDNIWIPSITPKQDTSNTSIFLNKNRMLLNSAELRIIRLVRDFNCSRVFLTAFPKTTNWSRFFILENVFLFIVILLQFCKKSLLSITLRHYFQIFFLYKYDAFSKILVNMTRDK